MYLIRKWRETADGAFFRILGVWTRMGNAFGVLTARFPSRPRIVQHGPPEARNPERRA